MARKVGAGDSKLMSRTAREALKPNRKPYYRVIERHDKPNTHSKR
jgi:hypothetical protein